MKADSSLQFCYPNFHRLYYEPCTVTWLYFVINYAHTHFYLECHRKQKGRKLSGTIMTAEQRLALDLKVTDTQIYIFMTLFA